jgi:hypothetical protein
MALRISNRVAEADRGLQRYGLAFWKDYLYVSETTSIKRIMTREPDRGQGARWCRYGLDGGH